MSAEYESDYDRWIALSDREATGDDLSPDEREFLVAFAETDPRALAEAQVWHRLSLSGAPGAADGDARLVEAAVSTVVTSRARSRARKAALWGASGAFAAAAAVAVWISTERAPTEPANPGAFAAVEHGAERLFTGSGALAAGARVAEGAEVDARGGAGCLALGRGVHACLAPGAKVRLSALVGPERHVDLIAGRVAVALAPLPAGERFSIVGRGTWSTAVGTAFTVELFAGDTVVTVVHEGKVAVGGERNGTLVPAHRIGLVAAGQVKIESLDEHARTETEEWSALAKVAGRSIEAPAEIAPPAVEVPANPEEPSAARRTEPVRSTSKPEAANPGDLLAAARQALRDQRWADAATAYRGIVNGSPGSSEAHTVLVPLSNLEIDRLGQPGAALARLDAYLAKGGALSMEARLARIRALRAMGRTGDELRALDEFLEAHPNAIEASRLRERRDLLRRP